MKLTPAFHGSCLRQRRPRAHRALEGPLSPVRQVKRGRTREPGGPVYVGVCGRRETGSSQGTGEGPPIAATGGEEAPEPHGGWRWGGGVWLGPGHVPTWPAPQLGGSWRNRGSPEGVIVCSVALFKRVILDCRQFLPPRHVAVTVLKPSVWVPRCDGPQGILTILRSSGDRPHCVWGPAQSHRPPSAPAQVLAESEQQLEGDPAEPPGNSLSFSPRDRTSSALSLPRLGPARVGVGGCVYVCVNACVWCVRVRCVYVCGICACRRYGVCANACIWRESPDSFRFMAPNTNAAVDDF